MLPNLVIKRKFILFYDVADGVTIFCVLIAYLPDIKDTFAAYPRFHIL